MVGIIAGPDEVRIRIGCAIERHLLAGEVELSAVVHCAGHLAFGERAGKSGHGEGGENGDDRNNDEHFDQGECGLGTCFHREECCLVSRKYKLPKMRVSWQAFLFLF